MLGVWVQALLESQGGGAWPGPGRRGVAETGRRGVAGPRSCDSGGVPVAWATCLTRARRPCGRGAGAPGRRR